MRSEQKESQIMLLLEPVEEKGTVSTFLQSRIHESFTRAADQLYAMGLLTTEERIAISSCIGDALEAFANIMKEKVPDAADIEVPVEIAQEILRNAILHRCKGIVRLAQEEVGRPVPSWYLDLTERGEFYSTLVDLIEIALADERHAIATYDAMLDGLEGSGEHTELREILDDEKDHDRKNGSDIVGLKEITDGVASKHFTDDPNPDIKGRFFRKAALPETEEELLEELSKLEHEQWAHWTDYMLNNLTPDNIAKWTEQVDTPYESLTDKEKKSDREWAEKALGIVEKGIPTTEAAFYAELIAIERAAQERFRFDPNSTENEGRWRLMDPKVFEQGSIRRWNIWKEIKAPGIQFVMGKDTRDNEWKPQAVRFKKFDARGRPLWTEEKAAKWWDQNKGEFEKEWTQSNWDEWMLKHPGEISPDYTGQRPREAVKVAQEVIDVAQCLECGKYFDTWTGEILGEAPPPGMEEQASGLCPEDARQLYEEILLEEATPEIEPAELEREVEEGFLEEVPAQAAMKRVAISGYCEIGGEWSDDLQKHRVRPGWEGGEYEPENIQLLCPKHHEEAHMESGEFEMGGQWRHDLLLQELGPEGYSEWQAARGRDRQRGLREQMGDEAYRAYQRLLALWRWHPQMFEGKARFGPRRADLDAPKTLAIDLDGTILEYDGHRGVGIFGPPKPGARETLSRFKDDGWFIVIDTCRGETPLVVEHLAMYNIPFDAVNFNPFQPDTANPGKPVANYRIDDSAIYFNGDWDAVYSEVIRRDREKELFAVKVAWAPPVDVDAALWDLSDNLMDEEWVSVLPFVNGAVADEVVMSWTANRNVYRMVRSGSEYKVFRNFDVIYSSDGALSPFEQVKVCADIVESGTSLTTPLTIVRDAMSDLSACLRKSGFNAPSEWLRATGWSIKDGRRVVRVEVDSGKFRKCNRALAAFAANGTVADLLSYIAHDGAFAYDPQKGILIDFLDPFGHRTQPQDYRDPAYWGVPEELKERARRRRERKKRPVKAPDETRDRVLKLREVVL